VKELAMSDPAKHEPFVREALRLAEKAVEHGNHPFGALLVKGDEVILTAENAVSTENDITRHAELALVSRASKTLTPDVLAQCTLYTSTEPCAMCVGAIFWAGIRRVVYACSAETLGEIAGSPFVVPSRELFARGLPVVEVIGPILEEEAAQLHRAFW
jgi:tRNA(Arg) A34 adenosine deaminase TadA